MTADRTVNLINNAYGYPIIGEATEAALKVNMDVIVSELGIGTIFEFLSYDVAEYSEVRKTIHARRFYQLFKEAFNFTGFNMEVFHKIQAGCIFVVSLTGIARGIDDYEYAGFVKDALTRISEIDPSGGRTTLNENLFYLKNIFEKFGRISLGIYSLQIFTKYGLVIQKINKSREGTASRLLMEIIDEINSGKPADENITDLLSLEIINPEELEDIIDEYISYAVTDIAVQGLTPGSKKADKANKKLIDDIAEEVHDAFSGLKMDVADLYSLNNSILNKKPIYDKEFKQPGVSVFFAALLERYASLFERLWYYEGNSFIKRLNMIFINQVKGMFSDQRRQELSVMKKECVRIIEEGLPGINVYELEGVLNGLSEAPDDFAEMHGLYHDQVKKVSDELTAYLDANIKTGNSIQLEMKNNLRRILGPEGIPEEELKILEEIVYDFEAVMDLLLEDEN